VEILLYRGAGHGDVLCLTSVIPGIVGKYEGCSIDFATDAGYSDLIKHDPRIRRVMESGGVPRPYDLVISPDHGKCWDDWIPKVQCRMAGVPFNGPVYYPLDSEISAAEPSDIAVCYTASDPRRMSLSLGEAVRALEKKYKVIQVDNGVSVCNNHPKLTIRQAAATMIRARLAITVDTSLMHVAVALRMPTIIIFESLTGPRNQYTGNARCLSSPEADKIVKEATGCLG
jgi:ADP-heptose:LPS heptosyltransferase